MCWRGNFNCTERYLLSLMFLIEPIWTRQPASQLAAQLGSFSSCGLHSCGTFDKDVRPSEPRQHSLYIFSNLLVIGLDGSSCFWTRTVIPHERGERFNDQHHFVCPSACDSQRSLLIHPIIDSKTLIGVVAFNVVTFQHRFKKPNPRLPRVRMDALRAKAQAVFPNRPAVVSSSLTRRTFPFPSSTRSAFLPRDCFTLSCWKSPHVCWKASFTGTQQPFQPDMRFGAERRRQAFNLSGAWKMTRRKERLWREECLFFDGSRGVSVD